MPLGSPPNRFTIHNLCRRPNLDPSNAPAREDILQIVLPACDAAAAVTHASVFREPHGSGRWHFHVATALSEPSLGWREKGTSESWLCTALCKHGFGLMIIAGTPKCSMPTCCSAFGCRVRRKVCQICQAWTKTHCCGALGFGSARNRHLLDAINGTLDSAAIEEKDAECFLQRYAAGKRGPCKSSDLELWPIVSNLLCNERTPFFCRPLYVRTVALHQRHF